MKAIYPVKALTDGEPVEGGEGRFVVEADGSTYATRTGSPFAATGDRYPFQSTIGPVLLGPGHIILSEDGSPGHLRLEATAKGITRRHAYETTGQRGAAQVGELPWVIRGAGDGVVPGFGGMLAASEVSIEGVVRSDGSSDIASVWSVGTGQALAGGVLHTQYEAVTGLTGDQGEIPAGESRIDRLVVRAHPPGSTDEGKTELAVLVGTPAVAPTAPALTQGATAWETPLASATLTDLGAETLTDERAYVLEGVVYRRPVLAAVGRRRDTANATAASATPASASVVLADGVTYDVEAEATVLCKRDTATAVNLVVDIDGNDSTAATHDLTTWTLLANSHARTIVGTGAAITCQAEVSGAGGNIVHKTACVSVVAIPRA